MAPASVGLDPSRLARIADQARRGKSNCLVVARDGKLAGEWYFRGTRPDTTQDVFSATKSVAGTLIGMAQDDGDLRIDDSAARWIQQWRGTPSQAVTVRDLLSMDSGRQWSPFTDYVRLLTARDQTEFAVGLGQEAAPGTVWAYNNSAVQTLDRVLENATGTRVVDFARRRLFAPLGMAHTSLSTDASGNAQMFEGMRSTCRDLARFGVLMLDHGIWSGRQIVSRAWVKAATGVRRPRSTPVTAICGGSTTRGSSPSVLSATTLRGARHAARGRLVPGAPDGMYWALGLGDQTHPGRPENEDGRRPSRDGEPAGSASDVRACRGEQGRHRGGRPRASVSTPPPGAGAARTEKLTRPASR